ncbi:MAG TPA: signal recognition particle protein [Chitinophagales bacterium]|nr:signal recognition particle protein [Chitinophagales bacterium]HAE35454.1 signal recognition particle protein [Bacteroidota bacterium]MCB9020086.1 signal recognition particle protein [Chitinophagales bacterium]MCB9031407.1 signal recognition particle protein [Chitinophagales bacterium]HPE96707.1 signal recognition particle protein [Chitinophagales bacterium]
MFESLSNRLESAFQSLKGQGRITEINIATTVKEIRRALVDADVNYKIAKEFTDTVKEKALGGDVLKSVSPGQLMVKIVEDELTTLMGGTSTDINLKGSPAVILIAGLQGSGKTTFSAKLARYIKSKSGRNPMLVACDVYRPAAINQLQVLGEQIGVQVYADTENKNPVDIAKKAISFAKVNNHNVVIIDTAGRLAVDEEMMDEITRIKQAVQPAETLFVVDSMTGQDAVNTAKAFNDRLDFDGVVLTKLDGDTRGGAALTIKYVVNKPIKFISQGEKTDTLDVFHPDRMARRILGMGDIVSLVEKAQEQYDAEQAAELQRKIRKNKFDFDDFLSQIGQIKKMGNIKDLMGMIPGVGKQLKDLDVDEKQFKRLEAMIQSMTPAERQDPDLLNGARRKRIADGSGTSIQDVNQFIKQFEEMRKMMKMMNKMGGGAKAAKALGMMGRR